MTYFPDLSPYSYRRFGINKDVVNIGWLDAEHSYPQGEVPNVFIDQLWNFCHWRVMSTRGLHECQFCKMEVDEDEIPIGKHGGEALTLGWAEIRVFGSDGRIYAAPNLIYHYVVEHHYRPPDEFVQAVLDSPLPSSPEYKTHLRQYGWPE